MRGCCLRCAVGPPGNAVSSSVGLTSRHTNPSPAAPLAFAGCAERHLKFFFPADDVRAALPVRASEPSEPHPEPFKAHDDADTAAATGSAAATAARGVRLRETCGGDAVLSGAVAEPSPRGPSNVPRPLLSLTITRRPGHQYEAAFHPQEVAVFARFCDVAAAVLIGVRRGAPADGARDGDVRALLLPLLAHLLPLLLGSALAAGPGALGTAGTAGGAGGPAVGDWRAVLSAVARGLKRVTGAASVSLQLACPLPPLAAGAGARRGRPPPLEASSEGGSDDEDASLAALAALSEQLSARLVDDCSVYRTAGGGPRGADTLVLDVLADPSVSASFPSALLGEIKVVGAAGGAAGAAGAAGAGGAGGGTFHSEHVAAVKVVAYAVAAAVAVQGMRYDADAHARAAHASAAASLSALRDCEGRLAAAAAGETAARTAAARALRTAEFAAQAAGATSLAALGAAVCGYLPRCLQVRCFSVCLASGCIPPPRRPLTHTTQVRAALLVRLEEGSAFGPADNALYVPVISPTSAPVDGPDASDGTAATESPATAASHVSELTVRGPICARDLARWPDYVTSPRAPRSKILVTDGATGVVRAAVLILHPAPALPSPPGDPALSLPAVVDTVRAAVIGALSTAVGLQALGEAKAELAHAEAATRDRADLRRDIAALHELKTQVFE